jgi:hypothetical protein
MEIAITLIIIGAAGYIFFKNLKKKASGGSCDCDGCSSHCSGYKPSK